VAALDAFSGRRELLVTPLPFVAVYQFDEDVQVLRILHGAQQWIWSE